MAIRAKLLEVVAQRIVTRVLAEQEKVVKVKVSVSKLSPPIQGDVERVSVVFTQSR
jgi:dihydroneopterin aldolase